MTTTMKKAVINTGSVLTDLRNGEKFTVESNDGKSIVAVNGDKKVTIKRPSALKMYAIEGTSETPAFDENDVELVDGDLYVYGDKVEAGTLKIEEILCTYPGNILLKVASRAKDNTVELFRYDVNKNFFDKVTRETFTDISVMDSTEKGFYMLNFISAKDVEIEGIAITTFDTNKVMAFYKDYCLMSNSVNDYACLPTDETVVEQEGDVRIITVASDARFKEITKKNDEGEVIEEYTVIEKTGKTLVTQYVFRGFEPEEGEDVYITYKVLSCTANSAKVSVSHSNDGKYALIVVGDDGIYFTTPEGSHLNILGGEAVSAITDYPNVVKAEKHNNKVIMTLFADGDDPEGVVLVDTLTKDRGYVVTAETLE